MWLKTSLLFVTLLIGSFAQDLDMSIFFDHTEDAQTRIVGGIVAGRVPYMVALSAGLLFRNLICGGSLVTENHVITAAHCVEAVFFRRKLMGTLRGIVGTKRYSMGGTEFKFASNITHPHYLPKKIKNDIGILVTKENIKLSSKVQPVALNYDFIEAGTKTKVYGWGRTTGGGSVSQNLMQLSTTVINGDLCATEIKSIGEQVNILPPKVEPHLEICTLHSIGHGTCNGDSGSPLVLASSEQQIGIVSWGLPCARGAPDMFTRISAFRDWIQQNTNKSTSHESRLL